jgi:integrase
MMAKVSKRTWISGGKEKTAWVVRYKDQKGRRHIRTFELKKKADDWLAEMHRDVKAGTHTPDYDSITVAEAAELWLRRAELDGCRLGTMAVYRSRVENYITGRPGVVAPRRQGRPGASGKPGVAPSSIANVKLSRLTTPMANKFYRDLLQTTSKIVARRTLRYLSQIIKFMQGEGLVAQNVVAAVTVKRETRRKLEIARDIPSKEEIC